MNFMIILSGVLLLAPPRSNMIGDPEAPRPPVSNPVLTPPSPQPVQNNSDIFPSRPASPSPALETAIQALNTRLDSFESTIRSMGPACECSSHAKKDPERSQVDKQTVYYITDKSGKVWYSTYQDWLVTWVDQQNHKLEADSRVRFATQKTPVEADPKNADLPKLIFKRDLSGHLWYDVKPDRLEGWINQKNQELQTQPSVQTPVIQTSPSVYLPPVSYSYPQGSMNSSPVYMSPPMNYSSGSMNYSPSYMGSSMGGSFGSPMMGGGFLGRMFMGGCGPSGCG